MSQWAVAALCTAVCRAWERPVDAGVAPGRQPWWPLISRPARHPAPGWRCSVGVTAHAARSGVRAPTPVSPSPHVGPFRGRQQRRGPRTAQVAMPHSGASGLVPAARCRRTFSRTLLCCPHAVQGDGRARRCLCPQALTLWLLRP